MKKFIEALKEAGIYDHIVETIVDVRNRYGAKDATKGCNQRNLNNSENRND